MKIEEYRSLTGQTRTALAQSIGVSRMALWRYETRRRVPEWPIMQRIYKVTRGAVTPNDFLETDLWAP